MLPHVESSFNPAAYSKVGAAGLWQFMRSTGRRYMRIDNAVDDRLDPFRSTEAAAQLLAYNYRLLGTWPLALTAYNHGAEGMRRARETLGTDDIVKIVRNYKGRTFGFASRNFYVSFLAALEIDRNPEKYFGPIERIGEARFQEVTVPGFVQIGPLAKALKIDSSKLRALNPALLRAVWDGRRHVPRPITCACRSTVRSGPPRCWPRRLAPGEFFAGQPEPRRYRVRRGDTIASVAEQYGVTPDALALANRVQHEREAALGRTLILPRAAGEHAAGRRDAATAADAEPIPVVGPGRAAPPAADALQSAPAQRRPGNRRANRIYVVQNGDSLSGYRKKVGLSEEELLKINGIRNRDFIFEGQQLTVKAAAHRPLRCAGRPRRPRASRLGRLRRRPKWPPPPRRPVGAGAVPAAEAEQESAEDAAAVASARTQAEGNAHSPCRPHRRKRSAPRWVLPPSPSRAPIPPTTRSARTTPSKWPPQRRSVITPTG